MIVFIHNPSFAVNAAATFSASVLERATDTWRLVLHAIAPSANVKTIPDVEREVSRSPPQSESVQPTNGVWSQPLIWDEFLDWKDLYVRPMSLVYCR